MDVDAVATPDGALLAPARTIARPGAESLREREFVRKVNDRRRASPSYVLAESDSPGDASPDAAGHLEAARRDVAAFPTSLSARTLLVQSAIVAGETGEARQIAHETLRQLAEGGADIVAPEGHLVGFVLVAMQVVSTPSDTSMLPYVEQLAHSRPQLSSLRVALAERAVDGGNFDEALTWLTDIGSTRARRLEAFVLLRQGAHAKAVKVLRAVLRDHPDDADTAYFLAQAFWQMGAREAAIQHARRAVKAAPGRRDIGLRLLGFLVEDDRLEEADTRIRRIKRHGVTDDTSLLAFEAQLALSKENYGSALMHLRRARELATAEGDVETAALAAANTEIVSLFRSQPSISKEVFAQRAREGLRHAPSSLTLANMLVENLTSTNDAEEAAEVIRSLERRGVGEAALLRQRLALARLRLDFETAQQLAQQLVLQSPGHLPGVATSIMLDAQVSLDWEAAADRAVHLRKKLPKSDLLLNNTAYVLSMAGRGEEALALFPKTLPPNDFTLTATRGLALIASGQLTEGLREYRRAGGIADKAGREKGRYLMTLHQAYALLQLGVAETPEVRASRLPSVPTPTTWLTMPDARLLQWMSERNGWWPLIT